MRRIALLVTFAGLIGWGIAGALGGCGGETAATNQPDGSLASSGGTGLGEAGASSSGSTSSSTSSTGGPGPTDGGTDGSSTSSSSGNPVSNPGKLTCGNVECDAGGFGPGNANRCCVRDGGANPMCSTANQCDDDDLELQCDEPADCPAIGPLERKCCLRLGGGGGGGFGGRRSECELNCGGGGGGTQLCKTNADCGDAGVCNSKKCGDYNLWVCGSPQACQ